MRHRTRAAGILSLLPILLSGCGGGDDAPAAQEPRPTSTTSAPTYVAASDIVGAVEVSPEDLPSEYDSENRFGPSGDQVDGQVTLDMCGAEFTSEDFRLARHQVGYAAPHGMASSETVAYQAGGADLAMIELRDAVASCPRGFVGSKVAAQPPSKMRLTELPPEPGWQEDSLALRIRLTPQGEEPVSGALIFQRRGDVLTAAYVFGEREASAALASRIASSLSAQLDAVSTPAPS